jgi:hypothetical protein
MNGIETIFANRSCVGFLDRLIACFNERRVDFSGYNIGWCLPGMVLILRNLR